MPQIPTDSGSAPGKGATRRDRLLNGADRPYPAAAGEPSRRGAAPQGELLVDGHVHYHDCFRVDAFLDGAVRNFRSGAWSLGLDPALDGCLLFAEREERGFLRRLRRGEVSGGGRWTVRDAGEPAALLAERGDDGARLLLVDGRQVVTREAVEVLALGSAERFEDGRPLVATLAAAERAGAIPVIPWGLGKWSFQRGALIASVLDDGHPAPLFLGDNSGRPHVAPLPPLFRAGAARGIRVLPGSDPLPLPWQERNAGRYGFVLEDIDPSDAPARGVVGAILGTRIQPRFFGRRERLADFVRAQVALRRR